MEPSSPATEAFRVLPTKGGSVVDEQPTSVKRGGPTKRIASCGKGLSTESKCKAGCLGLYLQIDIYLVYFAFLSY